MFEPILQEQIDAVCPNHGISFRDVNDNATWRIDFKPEATQAQKNAAQAIVDAFSPKKEVLIPAITEEADRRVDAALGDIRSQVRALTAGAIINNKRGKGQPLDQDDLDKENELLDGAAFAKAVRTKEKAAIAWVSDPSRTQGELDAYDPATDPGWP